MGRIRTIKPAFFKHEALFDAEQRTAFPLRVAFAGLWTVCDREGRFVWRPRSIKTDVLPYDDLNFAEVLDALVAGGFVIKYSVDGQDYGVVPGFARHQVVNGREAASDLPDPHQSSVKDEQKANTQRVDDASGTRHSFAHGEGKGKEGEKEQERKEAAAAARDADGGQSLIEKITEALGFDHCGIWPKYWVAPDALLIVNQWTNELGLTDEEIVNVALSGMQYHGTPANGPKVLTKAMQDFAAAKAAPRLTPSKKSVMPQGAGGHGVQIKPEDFQ